MSKILEYVVNPYLKLFFPIIKIYLIFNFVKYTIKDNEVLYPILKHDAYYNISIDLRTILWER